MVLNANLLYEKWRGIMLQAGRIHISESCQRRLKHSQFATMFRGSSNIKVTPSPFIAPPSRLFHYFVFNVFLTNITLGL